MKNIIGCVTCAGIALLLSFSALVTHAAQEPPALRFANILSSNMVLQQKKPAAIWGWAEPGAKLTVSIEEYDAPPTQSDNLPVSIVYKEQKPVAFKPASIETTAAQDGAWRVEFPAMDGSFRAKRILAKDHKGNSVKIENILIGEVWICSGQSNMVMAGSLDRDLWQNGLQFSAIRHAKYDFSWYRPLNDLPEASEWNVASTVESLSEFSSIAYVFARNLHMNLGVPIGIINNSRGGTLGISWTSLEALQAIKAPAVAKQMDEYEAQVKIWDGQEYQQRIAKVKEELVKKWLPETKQAIAAFWVEHDKFMVAHLNKDQLAEWRKTVADWRVKCDKKSEGGTDNLIPWKVWGLEDRAKKYFKGTDIKPPSMNYQETLWKQRPKDADARAGWSPPAGLFNGGVHPLKGLAIAGVLYYQGENQIFGAMDEYPHTFPTIVPAYRKLFGNEQLPFGIIGLPGFGKLGEDPESTAFNAWSAVRDIHVRTHNNTPNTGYISTIDCGEEGIHTGYKQPVGERAARWALGAVYGKNVEYKSWKYKSMRIKQDKILVQFEHPNKDVDKGNDAHYDAVKKGLTKSYPIYWGIAPLTFEEFRVPEYMGFLVAGKDQHWYPAKARCNVAERALEVWSDLVKEPVAVRYAWGSFPIANLGTRNAPVPSFRSDDWPCHSADAATQKNLAKSITDRKIATALLEIRQLAGSNSQITNALQVLKQAIYPAPETAGTQQK